MYKEIFMLMLVSVYMYKEIFIIISVQGLLDCVYICRKWDMGG